MTTHQRAHEAVDLVFNVEPEFAAIGKVKHTAALRDRLIWRDTCCGRTFDRVNNFRQSICRRASVRRIDPHRYHRTRRRLLERGSQLRGDRRRIQLYRTPGNPPRIVRRMFNQK